MYCVGRSRNSGVDQLFISIRMIASKDGYFLIRTLLNHNLSRRRNAMPISNQLLLSSVRKHVLWLLISCSSVYFRLGILTSSLFSFSNNTIPIKLHAQFAIVVIIVVVVVVLVIVEDLPSRPLRLAFQ